MSDVKLTPTIVHFKDYSGHLAPAFGKCVIKMFVKGLTFGDEFFVTQPNLQDVPLILGRTWQQRYNCSINWASQTVSCRINEVHTCVKLSQPIKKSIIQDKEVSNSTTIYTLVMDTTDEEGLSSSPPVTPS